jgi:serine/threonine protein kinase/hemoglobin-like flavoprotein/Ran GTPase-activating protein (RanGAP) involved in mRNA processing and transport
VRPYCVSCSRTIDDPDATRCPHCDASRPDTGFPRDARIGEEVAGKQYRVLRRIGAGGFGVVYEVETAVGGLRRALKLLARHLAADPDIRERFVNEALVLEQVHHPNVARCYAAGFLEEENDLYLLFELIDGVQLDALLQRRSDGTAEPLMPMRAVRLARQIAAALEAAHKNEVLHRDLKPDNILVIDAGSPREQVKVIDFGIAKLMDEGSAYTQTVVGTPEYMAPEQFTPGSTLDPRTDLWQLGATLFVMLTGRPPYARQLAGGMAGIIAEQRKRPDLGPRPSEVDASLGSSKALDLLVGRLLATDPGRRPASASEVCEELARIEHTLSPNASTNPSEALLGALCAMPSSSGWLALHSHLAERAGAEPELVAMADRMLASWPDELRVAPNGLWEACKNGELHPLWPIVRALDLAGRGLTDEEVQGLAQNPALATITWLDLSNNEIGNAGAQTLASSPHLGDLRHLDLGRNQISSQGVVRLANGSALRSLRSLRLHDNGIGARGIAALSTGTLTLEELELSGNDIGANGASALATGTALREITVLGLAENRIGPDGAAALAVSDQLRRLRVLDLRHNAIGPSGAAALALSQNVRHLRTLRLGRNALGRDGLQLLLASATFDDLEALDLSSNDLGASSAMLLAGSPLVRKLRELDLSDNRLGDAGIAALLGSANLAGLRVLGLGHNGLGAQGAALLADAPPQLESLTLSHNPLGPDGAKAIADALARLRLTRLELCGCGLDGAALALILDAGRLVMLDGSRNRLGVAGAEAVAASSGLRSLEELHLCRTELGPEGVTALAGAPRLSALRSLDLSSNDLGDRGVTALIAAAPLLSRLERLVLQDDQLGPDAAEILAASPLAGHLGELDLGHNQLGDSGAEALAAGPSWHALRVLGLSGNEIGLAGAAALRTASSMGTLQTIDLSHNALTRLVDMHSLGEDRIATMEASFAQISALGSDFAERFYEELFARYPTVKPLFARTPMARQHGHLMSALTLVVENLRRPDSVETVLEELGQRHGGYGVVPTYYYAVTSTLLDTIRDVLGESFTPELQRAWTEGLDAVASVMMRARHEPTPTRPENPA